MEISTKVTRVKNGKPISPAYIYDKTSINLEQELLLKRTKHSFVKIRTELREYGNITKMRLIIDGMVFKEWVVNNESKLVTKTLDHFR